MSYVIEMLNITKEFPGIKANDNITLQVETGEIHALLGENGAGKSTLMSVLFGLYQAEKGVIKVRGQEVRITSPTVATALGIGMVHQHFKLVHNFTVMENIILGSEPMMFGGRIDQKKAAKKVKELTETYNLQVDPFAKVEDISVGMQQRVEILKMLYRDADILIFDEPTAVLTPQEIDELMSIIKGLAAQGKSIVIITHKLKEIKAVARHCTVIRKGRGIGTVVVADTSETELAELMVGRSVDFTQEKQPIRLGRPVLEVSGLNMTYSNGLDALRNVTFFIKEGEILGVAGIEGNGQTQLIEAITGLREFQGGTIRLLGRELNGLTIRQRTETGLGHIPEDRHKHGLVLDYDLEDNFILQTYHHKTFNRWGILDRTAIRRHAEALIKRFDVRSAAGSLSKTRGLSGGNQQKAIIGRELSRQPKLLIAAQPTRGLDVGAIDYVHKELLAHRDQGNAILLLSLELDEILNISDRIAVIYEGAIVGIVEAKDTDEQELGLMMSGAKR